MKKRTINFSVNILRVLSIILLIFSAIFLFIQTPIWAAFTAQLGIMGMAIWSFVKEVFYYY